MHVEVLSELPTGPVRETYTCTHAVIVNGVLRLDNRPNSQQQAIGMHTVEHVISIPLHRIYSWKERP